MKRISWIVPAFSLLFAAPSVAGATAETDLAAATAAGHSVFLVVTERDASGIDVARSVASDAQKLSTETSILEMDRADSANQAVVTKYKLASVPVPLILVIASNGVAVGGARPQAITPSRLAAMVPSPAKAQFLKSLDERKASFLVFSRDSMPGRAETLTAASDAVTALKGTASIVPVSLDADKEASFIAEMKVDPKSAAPVVVVYNAKGQPTVTLNDAISVDALVAAATKEIEAAPCCPGGRCK